MKGAYLLAKDVGFARGFSTHLKTLGYGYDELGNSVRLNVNGPVYFAFYDRMENVTFYEDYEIPEDALKAGYKYAYLVECRDEELFCNIVKSAGHLFDFVVCDGDGVIHRPSEIDPEQIVL